VWCCWVVGFARKYSNTWLNRPPMSPPYWAGQTREPDSPADFISEVMKCARHFGPFKPENRIYRGRFNQVLLYSPWIVLWAFGSCSMIYPGGAVLSAVMHLQRKHELNKVRHRHIECVRQWFYISPGSLAMHLERTRIIPAGPSSVLWNLNLPLVPARPLSS
jgi:hypothetical protein